MSLTRADMDRIIRQTLDEVVATKPDGARPAPMHEDSLLLESGLDSLDFAILVTRLDEVLGFDPFSLSEQAYYPQTYGQLLSYYTDTQPR